MKFSLEVLEKFSYNALITNLLTILPDLTKKAARLDLYDEAYYNNNQSLVSDSEYDSFKQSFKAEIVLVKKLLAKIEKSLSEAELLSAIKEIKSLIRKREGKVGSKPSNGFKKLPHTKPMLSLNNLFKIEEIDPWFSKLGAEEILCELKIDGVSFSAFYSGGKLLRGLTRGDGAIGEEITENLRAIAGLPQVVNYEGDLEVRGEVYLDKETFLWLKNYEDFSNARNAASGSLRQLDTSVTAYRQLKYFVWDLFGSSVETQEAKLLLAAELGFKVNNFIKIAKNTLDIIEFYNYILEQRGELPYEIDGLVYKVNDLTFQEKLGFTSAAPRWAVAHKFPAEEGITRICEIKLQVGKSGLVTPLAVVDPITLGGATITRVTLHNAREVFLKNYKPGDEILLIRSGDVIPKVVKTIKESDNPSFLFPDFCPVCNARLRDDSNFVNKICTGGWNCFGQRLEKLLHFVSRKAFNIVGLGEKQLSYLLAEKLILTYSDLFKLQEKNNNLDLPLEKRKNWGKKSVELLFKNIEAAREITLDKFLYALAIPLVGQEVAKLIADHYHNYEAFISAVTSTTGAENLETIPGLGNQIAKSLVDFFLHNDNILLVQDLLSEITLQANLVLCKSEQFFFTGTLQNHTRQEAWNLLIKAGYQVASSLNKKVTFIVIGANPSVQKLDKAKKLGIIALTEEDFLQKLYENRSI